MVFAAAGMVLGVSEMVAQMDGIDDRSFVRQSLQITHDELQMTRLALSRAGERKVQTLARRLNDEDRSFNQRLEPYADLLAVAPAETLTPEHEHVLETLSRLQGSDFDEAFLKAIASLRRETVDVLHARLEGEQENPTLTSYAREREREVQRTTADVARLSIDRGGAGGR